MEPAQHDHESCDGDCGHCGLSERDMERADKAGLSGWRMVIVSGSSFVLPLILAVAGAATGGPSGLGQVLGAVAGLLLGALVAAVVIRLAVPAEEKP